MTDGQVALDQVLVVIGSEDRLLDVLPAKALIADRDSHKLTVTIPARSPSTRHSAQAPRLPGVR